MEASSLSSIAITQLKFLTIKQIYRTRSLVAPLSFVSVKNQSAVVSEISIKNQRRREQQESSTITYLIGSCGLSEESAILASKKVNLQNLIKPESVLTLLRNHEFSETQIAKIVRKRPVLLVSDPVSILLPKLEFLYSIGISKSDLAKILSADPTLLTRSLENRIIPAYKFLKSIPLSDEKIVSSMKRTTWIFLKDQTKSLIPNIELMTTLGVPPSCISLLMTHFPEAVMQNHIPFSEIVEEVKEMGFDVKKSAFVLAVHVLSGKANRSTWERCYTVYMRWGWSRDQILEAFRKHPHCMILSEKKIMKGMEFLVNDMGWSAQLIAMFPMVLSFSLERRIVPRCRVIQALWSKRLIKEDLSLTSILVPLENVFLNRYVYKYDDQVAELLAVYEGKVVPRRYETVIFNLCDISETQFVDPVNYYQKPDNLQ